MDTINKTSIRWKYFLMIVIIFLTDSLLFATNANYVFIASKRYITVLFALVLFLRKQLLHDYKKNTEITVLCISIIVSMIAAGELVGFMYFTQIAVFMFAVSIFAFFSFEQFQDIYLNIMRVVAIVSLVGFFFSNVFISIPFLPTIQSVSGLTFKTLFLTNLPMSTNYLSRNWGPFWEPGAYQMYLNAALVFALFKDYKSNGKKVIDVILFAFACLTTKSGASFVAIICFMIAFLLDQKRDAGKMKLFLIMIVGVGMVFLSQTSEFARLFEKTIQGIDNADNTSYVYRLSAAVAYIKGFLHSPIWGNSATYLESQMSNISTQLAGISSGGNTNTVLSYFAYYGLVPSLIIVGNLIRSTGQFSNFSLSRIMIFMGFVMMTSNENFMCSLLLACIVFMNVAEKEKVTDMESPA